MTKKIGYKVIQHKIKSCVYFVIFLRIYSVGVMDQFTMVSTPWWWSSKTRRTGMRSTTPARRGSRRHLGWSLKTQGLDWEVRSLRRCPASSTSPPSWSTISHTPLLRLFITRWSGYYDTTLHQGGTLLGNKIFIKLINCKRFC